jgi:hypothetical protein
MRIVLMAMLALTFSWTAMPAHGQDETDGCACCQEKTETADPLDTILETLQTKAKGLQHYQCKIDYVYKQPLLESQTRRKGMLYYTKLEERSYLRIDFETVQYDDEKEMKHREKFFFDGVWGTYIDYEGRNVQRQQVAEPNAPVDAFSLVSQRVPVLGFSKVEDLRKQFEIELVTPNAPEAADSHQLHMVVKPDSAYKEDYTAIDCRIDKKQGLPTRIVAVTTEQDVHEIQLIDAKTDQPVARERFAIEVPADFSVETIPLQRNRARN